MTGVLRGFDPFMNLVLDEAVEEVSAQEKHNIGMVVSQSRPDLVLLFFYLFFYFIILPHTMKYKQNKNDNK